MRTIRMKSNRPRIANDFYPTPYGLAKTALDVLIRDYHVLSGDEDILDAGAGGGIWGKALCEILGPRPCGPGNQISISGIDIETDGCVWYDVWYKDDFLNWVPLLDSYNLILGNPPYSLLEEFVRKSFEILNPNGYIFFLGRLEFLASRKRHFGLFTDYPLHTVYVLSRRPSFFSTNGRKTTDAQDYALYLWQKDNPVPGTELKWLYWEYDLENDF